jgi:DNA-directed RNA polymerase specialized sigma24 family protein
MSPSEGAEPDFEAFLELFDPDPPTAAGKYLKLREKLTVRFEQNGCRDAEELAAQAVERGRQKWAKGAEIHKGIGGYIWGIATNIIHEDRRSRSRLTPLDANPRIEPIGRSIDPQLKILLEQCMKNLDPEAALLMREFHGDRKQLAARLGISANALRIRYFRIMQKIRAFAARKQGERDSAK